VRGNGEREERGERRMKRERRKGERTRSNGERQGHKNGFART
jgi:hypothetical protein